MLTISFIFSQVSSVILSDSITQGPASKAKRLPFPISIWSIFTNSAIFFQTIPAVANLSVRGSYPTLHADRGITLQAEPSGQAPVRTEKPTPARLSSRCRRVKTSSLPSVRQSCAFSLGPGALLNRTTRDRGYVVHHVELLHAKISEGGVAFHLGRERSCEIGLQ